MRKIKVFSDSYPQDVQTSIDDWVNSDKNIRIISVSGSMNSKQDVITYVLYENKEDMEKSLLNS